MCFFAVHLRTMAFFRLTWGAARLAKEAGAEGSPKGEESPVRGERGDARSEPDMTGKTRASGHFRTGNLQNLRLAGVE